MIRNMYLIFFLLFVIGFCFQLQAQSARFTLAATSNVSFNSESFVIQQSIGQSAPINFKNNTSIQGLLSPIIDKNIANQTSASEIYIYPNPAVDMVKVNLQNFRQGRITYQILDMNGKVIKGSTLNLMVNSFEIEIGDLSAGTYVLSIKSDNGIYYEKFIKLYL